MPSFANSRYASSVSALRPTPTMAMRGGSRPSTMQVVERRQQLAVRKIAGAAEDDDRHDVCVAVAVALASVLQLHRQPSASCRRSETGSRWALRATRCGQCGQAQSSVGLGHDSSNLHLQSAICDLQSGISVMARGFESKDVEFQQAEAERTKTFGPDADARGTRRPVEAPHHRAGAGAGPRPISPRAPALRAQADARAGDRRPRRTQSSR